MIGPLPVYLCVAKHDVALLLAALRASALTEPLAVSFSVKPGAAEPDLVLHVSLANRGRRAISGEIGFQPKSRYVLRSRTDERRAFKLLPPGRTYEAQWTLSYAVGDRFQPKPFTVWVACDGAVINASSTIEAAGSHARDMR